MERQQDYVLRTVEERGVRFVRLWFTDVLGQLKSVAISPAELENAFDEGMHFDGSAIDGFSRVQESDVLAKPDPNSFELLPWAKGDDALGPHVLRHPQPRRRGLRGRPPPGAASATWTRPASRASPSTSAPEMEFFYFGDGDPSDAAQAARHRLLLRPDHRRRGQRPAQADDPMLEAMGIPVEYSLPRGRAQPARDRPALHRRADDGRQRHDLPPGGEARSPLEQGVLRHVHAQADSAACRARACTPTCRCSRATPTPSTSPATLRAVEGGPGLHRRPAACTPARSPR